MNIINLGNCSRVQVWMVEMISMVVLERCWENEWLRVPWYFYLELILIWIVEVESVVAWGFFFGDWMYENNDNMVWTFWCEWVIENNYGMLEILGMNVWG